MTLVGYWPLNEDSGDTAYDHSGKENHGSLKGSVTQGSTGVLGDSAYSFSGGNVSTNFSIDQTGSKNYTFSAWAKTADASGSTRQIISSDDGGYDWSILQGKNNAEWELFTGSGVLSSGITLDSKWHLITGVFDTSTNKTKLYVDGVLRAQGSIATDSSDNSINIGENPGNFSEPWDGKISEVRIYDRPLTKSEVQYLYSVGKRGRHVTSKKSS